MTRFCRLTLGAAGATALGIGLAITFIPQVFYAGYGMEISTHPAALSELRAPGANLAALGVVIAAGALRQDMARFSAQLGTVVFLAFAAGRIVSFLLDGWPGEAIMTALLIEGAIGVLCLFAWRGLEPNPLRHRQAAA
ncbi:hypothetical protein AYJ57_20545 (plasmid) [Salipiger sp. CCB-MM3]|uniref:DUF4345 domain-containing protein n=1 Tax=Salipiger sp. CCB-MM3 TaxID=1792508 RepID=UPI00080AABD8|nr:DUF4345 domain-containing protein [Salipiger sp. CCB-MM3]ANT62878.1 hypothetical protein AYJ57_20545 [Salipiger sp. CCB-MM3]